MDLGYLVELDPVYRVLCGYLRTSDCLRLRHVSKTFQELVTSNPNTWKRLDFTGGTKDVITYYLNNDVVPGALRELTLDCSDVSEMTVAVILMRCPNLRHLGLGGCTELMEGLLLAVLSARKNGHAQKLLSVGLLGAPHFKSTGVNAIAASVARDFAAVGITTDLMSCPEEHAFTSDPQNQWHLCAERAARCTACGQHARGCYPCINSRTCRGCFKFWCFGCTSPITRVCYECTRLASRQRLHLLIEQVAILVLIANKAYISNAKSAARCSVICTEPTTLSQPLRSLIPAVHSVRMSIPPRSRATGVFRVDARATDTDQGLIIFIR